MADQYYGESDLRTYQAKMQIASLNGDVERMQVRIRELEKIALPTADRDAIREIMQGALDFIKGPTTGGYEHIVKLTAALGLLGER